MTGLPRKFVSTAVTTTMVAAVAALLALAALIVAGYKPQVVTSGSMRPQLDRGSLIFVKPTPAQQLRVGDVITFENPIKGGDKLVTHRIVATVNAPEGRGFITRGDANASRDPWKFMVDENAGRLAFSIPQVGHLSFLVHSRNGYIALFILPLLALSGIALRHIWRSSSAPDATGDGTVAATGGL